MRFWLCAVVVAAWMGSASRAEALCAPQFWVGPPDGSYIPTRGSLYVYSGHFADGKRSSIPLRWIGNGSAEQTEISPGVFKITYRGTAGAVLVVEGPYGNSRYQLTSTWRAPTKAPTALAFEHDDSGGGCPSWNVLRVALDERPAAIRIRWTSSQLVDEWVLPARKSVEIGKLGCTGTTVPVHELESGGHLELFAIRLDGSEVAVTGIPDRISVRDVPAVDNRALLEAHLREVKRAQEARWRAADQREPRTAIVIGIVLLLAALGVGRLWLRYAIARLH